MKNIKKYILPTVISTVLIGCGGGDESPSSFPSSFDEQKVTYDFENIVEAFLNSNIDYVVQYKPSDDYSGELVKYYDKDGNIVDFKIPTNTTANHGCKAEPLSLDNRKFSSTINNTYFNVKPLSNNQRLVIVSSFPTVFTNKFLGDTSCRYGDFNFNKKYIISKSNEKLIDISSDETIVNTTNLSNVSELTRIYDKKHQTTTTSDGRVLLKPYSNTTINLSDHEFIINKNGEVKTFDSKNQHYITLPNTKGTEWQFFTDRYLVSKPYGGKVFIYDIINKQRMSNLSIDILQNRDTNLLNSDQVTISYGITMSMENGIVPFKYTSHNSDTEHFVSRLINGRWIRSSEISSDLYSILIKKALQNVTSIASDSDNAYMDLNNNGYFAATKATSRGFDLAFDNKYDPSSHPKEITDFPNYLENVHYINGRTVIETSTKVYGYEKRAFYLIDGTNKNIIGSPGEELTTITASAHNMP